MVKWNMYAAYATLLVIYKIFVNASHDMEVWFNDSVSIGCSPRVPMDIQWHHTGHIKRRKYVYAGRNFYPPYKGRLKIDNYSLLIPSVNSGDAGFYECSEEISGRPLNSAYLRVLESIPVCGSNMKSHGYVGPSTCNLEQEEMTFTCALSYSGKPPQMIWTTFNDSQAFNESTCKTENGRISCSLILKADLKYDGSIFTCQSAKSSANCSTEIIKIQYFESDLKLVEKNISDKVNCSVKSNQILHFKWTQLQGNQYVTVSKSQTLLIQSPGFYRCIAEYRIRNTNCSANGTEVFVPDSSISRSETGQTGTAAIIVPWLIVVIGVAGIIAYVLYRHRSKKLNRRRKNDEEGLPMLSKDDMVELENNLHKTRNFLEEIIDCDFGLIENLHAKGVLSIREIQDIRAENTSLKRNSLLLDTISKKKKIPELCEALKDTGQQHIVNYLRACGEYSPIFVDDWPLKDKEISIIESNHETLVDILDPDDLIDRLYACMVINRRQRDFISSKSTSYEKNDALLEILWRCSLRSYAQTIKCLHESGQSYIADILETGEGDRLWDYEDCITRNYLLIRTYVTSLEYILGALLERGVLTHPQMLEIKKIEKNRSKGDAIEKMIQLLKLNGNRGFECFIEALVSSDTRLDELARRIHPGLAERYIEIREAEGTEEEVDRVGLW